MSTKPLRAYTVQEEDEGTGGIVFARTNAEARKAGSSEFGDGSPDWGKASRTPWADGYAPGPVPKVAMIAHGWWFTCHGCGCRISNDVDNEMDDIVAEDESPEDEDSEDEGTADEVAAAAAATDQPAAEAEVAADPAPTAEATEQAQPARPHPRPVEDGDAIYCSATCRESFLVDEAARKAVERAALDQLAAIVKTTYPNTHIHTEHAYATKVGDDFVVKQVSVRFRFPGCTYFGAEMRIEDGAGAQISIANGDSAAWKRWTAAGCPAEMPVITTAQRLVEPPGESVSQRYDRLMPVYLERNNLVAASYGIEAAVRTIREGYAKRKRRVPPWVEAELAAIETRIVPIRDEMIVHRAEVEPEHAETCRRIEENNRQAATRRPH